MSDNLEQRILTWVKAPTTKVGQDKVSTYISGRADYEGSEDWYYVDKECPQWSDYEDGDVVSAEVKVFTKKNGQPGYDIKKMQKIDSAAKADTPAPQATASKPRANDNTAAQKRRMICLQASVESLPNNSTTGQILYRGDEFEEWVENGTPDYVLAARAAQAKLGGSVDEDIPFGED
uniref:Uncharacterized protein n=1 Tax=viral metagenome TaxID=1070528 RepID=A0A6M3JMN6_9ZZZZ